MTSWPASGRNRVREQELVTLVAQGRTDAQLYISIRTVRSHLDRARRAGRRLLAAVAAVLTGVLAAVVLYQTSLQPGAAITRAIFDKNALVTPPPGFGQIERAVTMRRVPIAVPRAPDAHLDGR